MKSKKIRVIAIIILIILFNMFTNSYVKASVEDLENIQGNTVNNTTGTNDNTTRYKYKH